MNNHSCSYRDALRCIINDADAKMDKGFVRIPYGVYEDARIFLKQESFYVISDEKGTFVNPSIPNTRSHYLLSNGDRSEESDDEFRDRICDGNKMVKNAPICNICNDTHKMPGTNWMCVECPIPCKVCSINGNGPFCEFTPCYCQCHKEDKRANQNGS
jgi:hypothetical protein